MDFLVLIAVYCVIFVVGVLCMLYRDSPVLNSGLIGTLKNTVVESLAKLIPVSLQNGFGWICNHLLYKKTCFFQLVFVVLCILGHAVWVVDMLPLLYTHYPDHNHLFWPLVFIFVNYFCWHKAWTDDPGVINKRNVGNYAKVFNHDDIFYIKGKQCVTCDFKKPARSKHCSICNRCVYRFDHHCIWTNNCVGGLNQRYFILFMATLLAVFIQGIYVGGGCVLDYAHSIKLFNSSYIDSDNSIKPVSISVAFQHLFMALPRLVFLVIALIVLTVLLGVFFTQHVYLMLTNQTTNERHKLQELEYNNESSENCDSDDNHSNHRSSEKSNTKHLNLSHYRPYSRGFVNNFLEVFLPHNFILSKIKQT